MDSATFDPDVVEFPSGHLVGGQHVAGDGAEFEVRRPSDGRLARTERGASPALVDHFGPNDHFGPKTEPNAPMGGYEQSGFGKDYGVLGMDEFLKTKNIAIRH